MKTIHVFLRQNGRENFGFADVFGQGSLNQNPVNTAVCVQLMEKSKQLTFGTVFGQDARFRQDADAGTGPLFHADVNFGGGIVADADENQFWFDAARFESGDALRSFGVNLFRDGAAVDQIIHGF